MAKSFEHLSSAQLEQYGTDSFTVTPDDAHSIEAHLEDCADCRSRLLDHHRVRFALLADAPMRVPSNEATLKTTDRDVAHVPSGDCPSTDGPTEDDLRNLAAGLLTPDKALAITQHVAQCSHCAPILNAFIQDFSDDLTEDEIKSENQALAQLKSSSPKWQKQIARQMRTANDPSVSISNRGNLSANSISSASRSTPHRTGSWPLRRLLAPAAIAASALIAFGLWFTQRDTPEKVEKLLAQAYTEQRTMEYRWPGAEWGPVRVTRGSGQSQLSRPSSQLEAERILAEHQGIDSSDPKWLALKGEAELLKNQLPAAIADLTAALSRDPASSRIKLLLAIAYAQQGDISGDRTSRENALQLLDAVMKDSQYANAARFNRSLLLEHLDARDKAREEWNTLLRQESELSWRSEDSKRSAESK